MQRNYRDDLQTWATLENIRQNMDMKGLANEILLEENYARFMKSYRKSGGSVAELDEIF